jgi:hypothetical protein
MPRKNNELMNLGLLRPLPSDQAQRDRQEVREGDIDSDLNLLRLKKSLLSVAPLLQHRIHLAQSEAVVRSRSWHHEGFVWSRVFNRESVIFSGHRLFVVRDDYLLVKTTIRCVPHSGAFKTFLFPEPLISRAIPSKGNRPRCLAPQVKHGVITAMIRLSLDGNRTIVRQRGKTILSPIH